VRIMPRSRTSQSLSKQPARLSVGDMQSALPKLQRRINEVAAIDPNRASDPRTPEFEAINDAVDATLIEIFGPDSIEYDRYSSPRLYAGGFNVYGVPPHEIIEGYEEGKKRVLIKLESAVKFINEKLADHLGASAQSGMPRSLVGVDLHPAIEQAAAQLFRDGHFANAVENACKALNNLVQMKSGNYQLDNTRLMSAVFSKNNPTLAFNELISQSDNDEQEGFMHLYMGACLAFRNPRAHDLTQDEPSMAFGMIVTVSFLAKMLDHATTRPTK
jgi:uncharacterized protein (TIGR02391 family)